MELFIKRKGVFMTKIFGFSLLLLSSISFADVSGNLNCDNGGQLELKVDGQRINAKLSTNPNLAYAEVGDGEVSGLMYAEDNSSLGEIKIKPDGISVVLKFTDGLIVRCRR
jgi:hypothetical protein